MKECVMPLLSNFLAIVGLLVAFVIGVAPGDAWAEQRIALVIGNAAYQAGALKTTANDAGLVAQTLEAAGFEVIGARDLDQDALRRAFRDFIDKAAALGPEDVAVVYLSGYGLQLEGENYFVPIDERIERVSGVPVRAIRLSDYTRALAALQLKVSIVILDLARGHPFATNEPLAGGLALVEPEKGMLVAFNAAPGTIAPAAEGDYGAYAKALAEMMREGGLPLNELFDRVRLRVSDATRGAQVPWHASHVAGSFVFFERMADAPPSVAASEVSPAIRSRAIRDLGAQEAYIAVLERDTLSGYLEFLDSYASDSLANRVRAIVAARREALIWRRTRWLDTPAAYWSYLRLYSDGPHAGDCYRRLTFLHASQEAPPEFSAVDYDVPPPLTEERIYVQQPVVFLGDPAYDFPPPPPIPASFLPPLPQEFIELPPPEPPQVPFELPMPVYTPVPAWVRPPTFVQPPPANNVIFANLHNKVAIDRAAKTFKVTDHDGHTRTLEAPRVFQNREQRHFGAQAGVGRQQPTSDTIVGPALPPSIAQRAAPSNGTRLDRAQREQPSALGRSNAATQAQTKSPLWADRPQRRFDNFAPQQPQRPGEPVPKSVSPPVVPGAATRTPPPPTSHQGGGVQSLWGGRTQSPIPGATPGPAQPSAQTGQLPPPAQPRMPPAAAASPQGPVRGGQALPRVVPPPATHAAPTRQPQQLDRQREQQGQAAAAAHQQQQAAEVARQSAAAAAARQQQQQPAQQAAGARASQQAAQQAAAARAQQQATQQAAAARAQQQAAQQAAGARASQQAAQQAAAARAQQQAAQQAAAARAQQQAAQQAAAARAQQQAAQQAAAARAQQQAAQQAAAARASQQAAQQAAAARAQQQAAQQASAARAQQQAAQQAAAARAQQQAAQQAAAAARASGAIGAARAQHLPPQRR
jgi:uncharacterized caspase-like protein